MNSALQLYAHNLLRYGFLNSEALWAQVKRGFHPTQRMQLPLLSLRHSCVPSVCCVGAFFSCVHCIRCVRWLVGWKPRLRRGWRYTLWVTDTCWRGDVIIRAAWGGSPWRGGGVPCQGERGTTTTTTAAAAAATTTTSVAGDWRQLQASRERLQHW